MGETYVSTEHLLLGLLREDDGVAVRVLNRMGIVPGRIRSEIERQVTRGPGSGSSDMQLTPRAKRIIDLAYDEARLLDNNYIGTEHLLLGLLREGDGLAGRVLKKLGLELEAVRIAVRELQENTPPSDERKRPLSAALGAWLASRKRKPLADEDDSPSEQADASQSPYFDPAIIQSANLIISQAIRERATHINIDPTESDLRIRYRIDGVLNEVMQVTTFINEELIACFKTLAGLNAARHDIPQHGTLDFRSGETIHELRVHAVPTLRGEKVVVQIPQDFLVGLAELGCLEDDAATLGAWMARRSGLILLAGSTGSGKTTTAYNLLREFTGAEHMVVALQNPLDQPMPGVTSYSVDPMVVLKLESVLEAVLCDQADVIFVERVLSHPWNEAFSLVLNAALAGPLVLLEYHATSAAKALNGLVSHVDKSRLLDDS